MIDSAFLFRAIAERMLEGLDIRAQNELLGALRKMSENLSRGREDPSPL